MGFRFRKSFKIAPGIKLNFNKNSTGLTFGGKGFHYTMNSKGKGTATVGVPGTGLSYSSTSKSKKPKEKIAVNGLEKSIKEETNLKTKKGCLPIIAITAVIFILIGACSGGSDDTGSDTTVSVETTWFYDNTKAEEISTEELISEILTTKEIKTEITQTVTEKKTEFFTEKHTEVKTERITERRTERVTEKSDGQIVYISPNGERFHLDPDCAGKNGYAVSRNNVGGRTACKKCAQ